MEQGQKVFVDETGEHLIPRDGELFECFFCKKDVFAPKWKVDSVLVRGEGVFCSEVCENWFKECAGMKKSCGGCGE